MKTPSFVKKSLYSAFVFFGTLLVLSAGYATWNSVMMTASSGSTLSSSNWNVLVDNVTDLNSRWTRNGAALVFTGGNVGIGIAVPGTRLHIMDGERIQSTSSAQSYIQLDWNAGTYAYFWTSVNGWLMSWINNWDVVVRAQSAPLHLFSDAWGITINSSGKIGIGTTTPNGKLSIANNVSTAGPSGSYSNFQIILYDSSTANASYGLWISSGTMWFNSNGYYDFYAAGTRVAGIGADGTYTKYSDIRLKQNIQTLSGGLAWIQSIRWVVYDWKDKNRGAGNRIGVIAQEVEKVFPELVNTDSDGMKKVDYSGLVAPLIEAVKELSHKIEEIFTKYIDQQKEIDDLKSRIENLEKK